MCGLRNLKINLSIYMVRYKLPNNNSNNHKIYKSFFLNSRMNRKLSFKKDKDLKRPENERKIFR